MEIPPPHRFGRWTLPGLIVLLTLVVYLPALFGNFIWDDDYYVTANRALRTADGLRRIWCEVGATPQYYPLVQTTFWLEYHVWGLNPFGYHLVNVLLHALAAILLARMLERLAVPGAWWAAAIFALHPLNVESVAWITERKNVLCGVCYFAAALAYWRYVTGSRRAYALALLLFVCALLSKTVACTLPAALLLILWWKRNSVTSPTPHPNPLPQGERDLTSPLPLRERPATPTPVVWRRWGRVRGGLVASDASSKVFLRDLLALFPFFAIGAGLGMITAWVEKHQVGARGPEWDLSFLQRCLIAGRAVWFYAGKLVWPVRFTFIYPRWVIDAQQPWQFLFPLAALAVVAMLWWQRRRWGRGPLVAVLIYTVTLGPALGFVNIYPMRYSFVADHFAYLAGPSLIALLAASGAAICSALAGRRRVLCSRLAYLIPAVLGVLTWHQAHAYAHLETLWRDTLRKNPTCWMAHNNLGLLLAARGADQAALAEYQAALRDNPHFPDPHNNIANLLRHQGHDEAALAEYVVALEIEPGYFKARYNLAVALMALGRTEAAMARYREVIELDSRNADAHYNLGIALGKAGRYDQAIAEFEKTTALQPDRAEAWYNLGFACRQRGDQARASVCFQRALALNPEFTAARQQLDRLPR